jgi:hypothetical protein
VSSVRRKRPILRMVWMMALALILPLGIGLWLDHRLGVAPLFVLAGALMGILAATVSAVWVAGGEIEALGTPTETSPTAVEKQEGNKEDTA